jgi:hypothetical protein
MSPEPLKRRLERQSHEGDEEGDEEVLDDRDGEAEDDEVFEAEFGLERATGDIPEKGDAVIQCQVSVSEKEKTGEGTPNEQVGEDLVRKASQHRSSAGMTSRRRTRRYSIPTDVAGMAANWSTGRRL